MIRLLNQDIRFQFRHGFYYLYAFLTALYSVILLFIPIEYRPFWSLLLIFTDPGTLGFFFVGTIVMLERNQHILMYLFTTPVTLRSYLMAKLLSLMIISLLTSIIIAWVALGMSVSYFLLTLTVVLCTFFFTSCGLAISVNASSLNVFTFRAVMAIILLTIPAIAFFGFTGFAFLTYMPSYSVLVLLELALTGSGGTISVFIFHSILLFLWGVAAFVLAVGRFKHYILFETGKGTEVQF
ncbi:ABC transporter permease [Alteribacter keqinensis]|uniref:ABC transporter permease n=1 Tax=Alteribacter keqinensis TaxID=2483800 RepID=A0A3M7TZS4_9BACI|nr:ABC transporter permease [Alteribacter keqinensis]RNA69945.1 ABC transporter permease [Alteribacter keqinensis]